MKLKTIELKNFRGIESLTVPFDGKNTILFGTNGVGKSAILRSIDLIYANILAALTNSKKSAELECDDISYGKSQAQIDAVFVFEDEEEVSCACSISRSSGRENQLSNLKRLTEKFEDLHITKGYNDTEGNWIESEDDKNMPIFVSYGVNRSVIDAPVRTSDKEKFTKLSAFDKAIESRIDFKNLFRWFRNQEDMENQYKVRNSADYEDKSLAAVKKAMLTMLDGSEDIHIDRKPLAMKLKKNGQYLNIKQLSDGEKCTIALFGDLARRMALANPKRNNPLEGTGVVLIDELDLHMHTSWQRKVTRVLKETFPNIQFIITTHSPQILGEIDKSINLFHMTQEHSEITLTAYESFVGWDSNLILEEVMHTSSVSQEIKNQIAQMYNYIQNKEYEKAEKIADALDNRADGYIDAVAKARVLISRGRRREANH